jgi:TonB family protein
VNYRLPTCLAALILSVACPAQTPDQTVAAVQRWIGRALIVRGFYSENELHYDATGKVEGTPRIVDWTLAGVDLDAAKRVDADTIELDGMRVLIHYDFNSQLFDRRPQKNQRIKILVGIRKTGSSANALLGVDPIEETLAEAFSVGIDPPLQHSMPDYWQHYFNPNLPWPNDGLEAQTIYPVKDAPAGSLTPSKVARKTDPAETPEADHDKIRGAVGLRLIVDAQGQPKRIAILRPLGYGLDALAAQAARGWTFEAARAGDQPVAARTDVWQNFVPKPPAH